MYIPKDVYYTPTHPPTPYLCQLICCHGVEVKALIQLLLVLFPLRCMVQPGHARQEQCILRAAQLRLCRQQAGPACLPVRCSNISLGEHLTRALLRLLLWLLLMCWSLLLLELLPLSARIQRLLLFTAAVSNGTTKQVLLQTLAKAPGP